MSDASLPRCGNCAYFNNTPIDMEAAIEGLRTLSSGFAAIRDRDGLCALRERYLPERAHCEDQTSKNPSVSM